ncbi:hypothetical protein AK830_g7676 [Neonectria ditissima]|uniref:Actin-like protein ARP9 n=1 Tax=Neonectria ditissima TaxID=78410 RepID=A0A0P7AM63_9HYPO|nr:hypothetical protein AK830_g7676 [Neonectria ditissima]
MMTSANHGCESQAHVIGTPSSSQAVKAPATSTTTTPATEDRDATSTLRRRARKDSQASPTPSRRSKRGVAAAGATPGAATPPTRGSLFDDFRSRISIPKPQTPSKRSIRRRLFSMSSTTGKWREEQVLIICPGSRATMAQLGCSELTLPARRMQTRMFRDGDQWAPYYRAKRTKVVDGREEEEWVEDIDSDEGAVYPIQAGRIVNMPAFLAFLDHVHGLLTTTYHNTPIMLMAAPQWTRPDCETIARYIFENTRTPALCVIHSGIATQYGLKWPHMTVVDIGYQKVDVTAIHDGRVANHMEVSASDQAGLRGTVSGGEFFTQSLLRLLDGKGFNHDMAEQLKKSPICEVLPYVGTAANLMELPVHNTSGVPVIPAPEVAGILDVSRPMDEGEPSNVTGEDEGVLDVATIVTTGQTKEFLAKKEKEKSKPGRKAKGDKDADASANKPARLPNSKRTHNVFFFEEVVLEDVPVPLKEKEVTGNGTSGEHKVGETNGTGAPPAIDAAVKEAPQQPVEATENKPEEKTEAAPTAAVASTNESPQKTEKRPKRIRRDIEVGLERFKFAERAEIDRIATTIYRTIQSIDDMYMRPACWENLVFVGNGSRLRGLKENIIQTLTARYLISPSTATMFTSELPSNVATPTGTGSQTPTGSFTGAPHQLSSSGVNPLLQAATTANAAAGNTAVATPQAGSEAGGPAVGHHFHSQTPTSIKTANLPTYLAEWAKNGFEESMFLGAQVAARIAFCLHTNMDAQSIEAQRLMSLSRVDYNELGPKGIRTHSMLG